jgi:hypothetical protein
LQIQSRLQLNYSLIEGLESGDPIEVNDEWWAEKRQRLLARDRQLSCPTWPECQVWVNAIIIPKNLI